MLEAGERRAFVDGRTFDRVLSANEHFLKTAHAEPKACYNIVFDKPSAALEVSPDLIGRCTKPPSSDHPSRGEGEYGIHTLGRLTRQRTRVIQQPERVQGRGENIRAKITPRALPKIVAHSLR